MSLFQIFHWTALAALLASAPLVASVDIQSIEDSESKVVLNSDWGYYEQSGTDPARVSDSVAPVSVNLPHSWNKQYRRRRRGTGIPLGCWLVPKGI